MLLSQQPRSLVPRASLWSARQTPPCEGASHPPHLLRAGAVASYRSLRNSVPCFWRWEQQHGGLPRAAPVLGRVRCSPRHFPASACCALSAVSRFGPALGGLRHRSPACSLDTGADLVPPTRTWRSFSGSTTIPSRKCRWERVIHHPLQFRKSPGRVYRRPCSWPIESPVSPGSVPVVSAWSLPANRLGGQAVRSTKAGRPARRAAGSDA